MKQIEPWKSYFSFWWWGALLLAAWGSFMGVGAGNETALAPRESGRTVLLTMPLFNVDFDDVHLTAPELIQKKGYRFECHTATTSDGYLLALHRIPPAAPTPGPGGAATRPVILFHGMFQSSRDFLMNSAGRALAYKLADAGFDVWLANARGSQYSRGHTTLSSSSSAFWEFSVDEVIKYDAPAIIDLVLQATGAPTVDWIGYSLGTAVGLGLGATQEAYNAKIGTLVLLGTTAYVGGCKSPVLRLLAPFERWQTVLMTLFNHGESLPWFLFPFMRSLLPLLCFPEAELNIPGFCSAFLWIVAGISVEEANPRWLPVMLGGTPGSLGIRMLSQWYQWINCGEFTYFDYGNAEANQARYGMSRPPAYDLTRVTTRVVNFYADNDWLSVPEDVARTVADLPNVVFNVRVPQPTFNHLDFVYGKDADVFVYDQIVTILQVLSTNKK